MISHNLKFIFIHIPKTSGNSLSLFLKDFIDNEIIHRSNNMGEKQGIDIICEKIKKDIKHKDITYYKNTYGEKINDYFKFTIVRNPYDRMLSYYFWSKGKNNQKFDRNEFINFIKSNTSFQHEYIDNTFHIIHFENIINELKNIECFKEIVDFNNYPTLNASSNSKRNYNEIYDKELKDLVFNKYKKDFELFGYKY
tara:strand:- start:1397 stop:1984 length:588 start_codon:yes stop_codon:yes gene_type:complete